MDVSLVLPTLTLAVGCVAILLGMVIVRENPRNRLNWVLALLLFLGGAGTVFGGSDFAVSRTEPKLLEAEAGLLRSFASLWEFIFPCFLLFALLFPREHRVIRRFPALIWVVFIPHLANLLVSLIGPPGPGNWTLVGLAGDPGQFTPLLQRLEILIALTFTINSTLFSLINLGYMVLAIVLLRSVRRVAVNTHLIAQLSVMLFGTSACFGLYAVAVTIPALAGFDVKPVARTGLVVAGLTIASLSIAYAIVRYRFLDAKLIARRTILYSTASGALLALYITAIHGLHQVVADSLQIDRQVTQTVFLVVALLVFHPFVGRLEEWLESLFMRDPRDYRTVLRQLAHEVATVLDLNQLSARVMEMLEQSLMVDRAALLVRRTPQQALEPAASFGLREESADWAPEIEQAVWSDGNLGSVAELLGGTGVVIPNEVGQMLVVPLAHGGDLLGALLIGPKLTGGGFNAEDRSILTSLGYQMGVAIRNGQLHQESVARRLLDEELRFARRVQQSFLPELLPQHRHFEVSALNLPSKMVGGDYVDALSVATDELMVAIGDVSGKGVPAALLMSMTRAALRTQAQSRRSPAAILESMNTLIHESTGPREFVTFFLAHIDQRNLTMTYSNGGHDWPLLRRRDGCIERLGSGGMLLGAIGDAAFEEQSVRLEPGDLLVLYTDGLTEARRDDEMLGDERLEELVAGFGPELSASEVLDRLVRTCREWTGGGDLEDDMTLLVMRACDHRTPGSAPPARSLVDHQEQPAGSRLPL